jgi:hypothetical protein
MRETGEGEEGQIMGELGGRGLESRKAEAKMSMVQSEATIASSETLESSIYASFTALSVYSDELLVEATRSAQVEEDRSTSVSPAPEFGKAGSELVDSGAYIEVGSSSDLTITSGGIPTSSSYLSSGILILNFLATTLRRYHQQLTFMGLMFLASDHAIREAMVGIRRLFSHILESSSK